jgi:hypothetical protein
MNSTWNTLISHIHVNAELNEYLLWNDIRQAAKSNKVLQDALERAIIIYHLTENKDGETS